MLNIADSVDHCVCLDLDAIMDTGEYSLTDVMRPAPEYDPGFDPKNFEGALRQTTMINTDDVAVYGVSAQEWRQLQQRVVDLADDVQALRVVNYPKRDVAATPLSWG